MQLCRYKQFRRNLGKIYNNLRKYKYKIYITKVQFNSLKNNINFLNALRLARIVNAIRASQSIILRLIKDNTKRGFRDKFEAIQYYGAVLYESLKTFHEMKEQFKSLSEYRENIEDINYICDEFENKNSFTRTILVRIRDKLVFHFDKDVFKKAIRNMDLLNEEFIILEGDSKSNIDSNYSSTTMLYFNYLISYVEENISDKEKLEFIYNKMDSISEKICKVIENIIYGLLEDNVELKES